MVAYVLHDQVRARCNGSSGKPVIYLHGDADPNIAGPGGRPNASYTSTRDWLLADRRCTKTPSATPGVARQGKGAVYTCEAAHSVELWLSEGGGHCWPGAGDCGDFSANALILDYWRRVAGFPV